MDRARRQFLVHSSLGMLGAAVAGRLDAQQEAGSAHGGKPGPPPGQPPTFAGSPAAGPAVSSGTFAEAEKLVQVHMSEPHLDEAAESWREAMAPLYERRTGPRKVALEPNDAPWSLIRTVQPGVAAGPETNRFLRSHADPGPLPASDEQIAYAPVTKLSRWIEKRQISSERLTKIYLARLQKYNPTLRCVITLTPEHALEQAVLIPPLL